MGTCGAQQAFEVQAGYHVFHLPIAIVIAQLGIENIIPGRQNNCPDLDLCLLRLLVKKVLIHDRRTIEIWYRLPNSRRFENCNNWLLR